MGSSHILLNVHITSINFFVVSGGTLRLTEQRWKLQQASLDLLASQDG